MYHTDGELKDGKAMRDGFNKQAKAVIEIEKSVTSVLASEEERLKSFEKEQRTKRRRGSDGVTTT